jgi:type I restriction enzyme R subunit
MWSFVSPAGETHFFRITPKVSPNLDEIFELKPIKAKPKKLVVLGVNVVIEEEIQIELDGNYVSYAEYRRYAEEKLKEKVHTLDDLKEMWIDNSKRKELLEKLKEEHVYIDFIKEIENLTDTDGFDVIARIVFNAPLITKDERVKYFINKHLSEIEQYGEDIKEIVFLLLEKYKRGGVEDLTPRALKTPDLEKHSALNKLKSKLGIEKIPVFFKNLRERLYAMGKF